MPCRCASFGLACVGLGALGGDDEVQKFARGRDGGVRCGPDDAGRGTGCSWAEHAQRNQTRRGDRPGEPHGVRRWPEHLSGHDDRAGGTRRQLNGCVRPQPHAVVSDGRDQRREDGRLPHRAALGGQVRRARQLQLRGCRRVVARCVLPAARDQRSARRPLLPASHRRIVVE